MSAGSGRPFGLNAGSFADASRETLQADTAAAAAEIAPALAVAAERQAAAAQFIAAHGHEVVGGHAAVPPALDAGGPV